MMAAGRLDGFEGTGEDPLLERGIADAESGGCFARFEENVYVGHAQLLEIKDEYMTGVVRTAVRVEQKY